MIGQELLGQRFCPSGMDVYVIFDAQDEVNAKLPAAADGPAMAKPAVCHKHKIADEAF